VRPDEIVVVVPTYNEAPNLAHMTAAVLLHGYRMIIVDDNYPSAPMASR
jgi:glycosyltransferase involved in cell wall biosynthesis